MLEVTDRTAKFGCQNAVMVEAEKEAEGGNDGAVALPSPGALIDSVRVLCFCASSYVVFLIG